MYIKLHGNDGPIYININHIISIEQLASDKPNLCFVVTAKHKFLTNMSCEEAIIKIERIKNGTG